MVDLAWASRSVFVLAVDLVLDTRVTARSARVGRAPSRCNAHDGLDINVFVDVTGRVDVLVES